MKSIRSLIVDAMIIFIATIFSIILRDNFDASYDRTIDLAPYLMATFVASTIIIPLFRVDRLVWRFSALPDYLRLIVAMAAITVGSVALTFAFNRLDEVPRSLPFIQFNLSITLLIGLRVFYRLHHSARLMRRANMAPLKIVEHAATETVLLVGLSRLTEIYLQSVAEFASGRVRIAGILGNRDRHVGRLVATHAVLGLPENIDRIVSDLEVRGVVVNKVIVTASFASLAPAASKAIANVERCGAMEVIYIPKTLGLEADSTPSKSAHHSLAFKIHLDELKAMQRRRYWAFKRTIDVFAAVLLLIIMSPIMLLVAVCVSMSIGTPLIFWQQRPGLGGRPFCLYKFRTMSTACTADGCRLSDEERMLGVGDFLRRTRVDELPQLFNIIRGDMSFVGPRPLLPRDQDNAYRARLLVRPGLTGWAQVVGGRAISAEDKAALDVWYVKNASLSLDLRVLMKTLPLVIFGEKISSILIERAWSDLRKAGVLQRNFASERTRDRAAA
jgi:lipopolysaccharide/colanic/teichoic acid biosynthesis glycosyltransferase